MGKAPIDIILDGVDWQELGGGQAVGNAPCVTHKGVLDIAGHRLRVYQLSDGKRIIAADDLEEFFAAAQRAVKGARDGNEG